MTRQPTNITATKQNIILHVDFNEDLPKNTICYVFFVRNDEFLFDIEKGTIEESFTEFMGFCDINNACGKNARIKINNKIIIKINNIAILINNIISYMFICLASNVLPLILPKQVDIISFVKSVENLSGCYHTTLKKMEWARNGTYILLTKRWMWERSLLANIIRIAELEDAALDPANFVEMW
ncbi:hypothetical protein AGLY_017405 [Aphis glycines]|uniref:Uncharacterized protein n=1 Tax=Aphis glycines TaxID=307491 RepID=A0A6G0SVM1_APHGL|nr:hypothetical protein AGLY_017405 [Aphis glycines]